MEYRKSTTCTICWLKSILHEEKRRTGSDSGRTNTTKTVSDIFRHQSRTGKSYCQTRSDVGSERVKIDGQNILLPQLYTICMNIAYLLTPWSRVLLEKLTVNFAASPFTAA
jgi:hypothetical protein